jgi:hypothetical protein
MTVPLVILAAFSFYGWWGEFPEKFFRAPAYLESFPETASVEHTYWPGGEAPGDFHAGHGPGWFHAVAMVLGLIGIGVGVSLFWSGRRDEKTRILPKGVHDLALNKYFMDEMYLDGFVANANRVSDACDWVDRNVVDGVVNTSGKGGVVLADVSGDADQIVVDGAVNLTADVAQGAGAVVATAQTGRIRNYLAAAIGVTALAVVILVFVIG